MKQPPPPLTPSWYPLGYSLGLLLRSKRLLAWSIALFLATVGLTAAGYQLSTEYVDSFATGFLVTPPEPETTLGWIKFQWWKAGKMLFFIITRVIAFYLAFLVAYCLTTPGYAFLSGAVEKIQSGRDPGAGEGMGLIAILVDIFEGVKIALFGVLITVVALIVNLVPGLGQGAVFVLYAFYSALMFIDYPTSRRRWSLGRKIGWLRQHSGTALRIGLLPAAVSMIPILNVFLLSLLFPLFTIYSTLNFSAIEQFDERSPTRKPV